ncbi:MAG: hypothetical protein ACTSV6_01275, partial [Candidatus Heimdallarchaeota archaeon]
KILSVDGGRVKVDFNHPLAGKVLEYEIEVVGKIEDATEKVKAIVYYFTNIGKEDMDVRIAGDVAEIEFKKHFNIAREGKELIAKNISKWIEPIKKVKFTEVFSND